MILKESRHLGQTSLLLAELHSREAVVANSHLTASIANHHGLFQVAFLSVEKFIGHALSPPGLTLTGILVVRVHVDPAPSADAESSDLATPHVLCQIDWRVFHTPVVLVVKCRILDEFSHTIGL